MHIGVTLPQFRSEAEAAISVAQQAEAHGLDGVFVFDHLWPIRQPDRPALHSLTLLGALTAETRSVVLGPLVARVGLVPDAVLVHGLLSLARMAGDRLVVGLGTGDRVNRDENLAYGRPFAPAGERLASVRRCAADLGAAGVPVWVGGRSTATRRTAAEVGAWNCWGADVATFAAEAADVRAANPGAELTWGGQVLVGEDADDLTAKLERHGDRPGLVAGTVEEIGHHLRLLGEAGATWAVCAPLDIGGGAPVVERLSRAAAGK
ncbi:MAG: LLM class flavin-dependent oxidoreductase [Acidimicrobiales bacterium]